ncbi:hypothetical protein RJG79_09070 [Mycoplasmatota bacterium WC44]
MKGKLFFFLIIISSAIINFLFFYCFNFISVEYAFKVLQIVGIVSIVFIISLTIYAIELGVPKRIALLFLLPIVYGFVFLFITHFLLGLFSIKVIFSINNIIGSLFVLLVYTLNYKYSKNNVILLVGIFKIIDLLLRFISSMGITLNMYASGYFLIVIRDIILILFLMNEITRYYKTGKNHESLPFEL